MKMTELEIQSGEETRFDEPERKTVRTWKQMRPVTHAVRSLDKVGNMLGLSRQRVHEIEASAIRKLRHAFVREMPSLKLRRNESGRVCGLTETN
jgi:DNA-directed RNA polymerase sigma subunit (sigma70/sigma32)